MVKFNKPITTNDLVTSTDIPRMKSCGSKGKKGKKGKGK